MARPTINIDDVLRASRRLAEDKDFRALNLGSGPGALAQLAADGAAYIQDTDGVEPSAEIMSLLSRDAGLGTHYVEDMPVLNGMLENLHATTGVVGIRPSQLAGPVLTKFELFGPTTRSFIDTTHPRTESGQNFARNASIRAGESLSKSAVEVVRGLIGRSDYETKIDLDEFAWALLVWNVWYPLAVAVVHVQGISEPPTHDPFAGYGGPESLPDVPSKEHVADLVPDLELRKDFTQEDQDRLFSSTERLRGDIHHGLQEDWWSTERGFELGLNEDIERYLRHLEDEFHSASGEPADPIIAGALIGRLNKHLIEAARRLAVEDGRDVEAERLQGLREGVVESFLNLDGTANDIEPVKEALDELAFNIAWADLPTPSSIEGAQWSEFTEFSKMHPAAVLVYSVGWRSIWAVEHFVENWSKQDSIEAIGAGAVGFGGAAASANLILGLVGQAVAGAGVGGAVVAAIFGVYRARFGTPQQNTDQALEVDEI